MRFFRFCSGQAVVFLFLILSAAPAVDCTTAKPADGVGFSGMIRGGRASDRSFFPSRKESGIGNLNEEGQRVLQKLLTHLGEEEFDFDWQILREKISPHQRRLDASCGETIQNLNVTELQALLSSGAELVLSGNDFLLFKIFVLQSILYGISVRKICAKCTDFPGRCSSDDYGADVTHSGLVMFPLTDEGKHVAGTHVGSIFCHGTQASSVNAPSVQWLGVDDVGRLQTITGAFYTGLTASTTVFPDYTGYMDSAYPALYRSYLIRQSYVTATLPLWYQAQEILSKESDCQSAIADAVVVTGYSEGGFAATAVALALTNSGDTEVLHLYAGGAPLRLSSAQIRFSVNQLKTGAFANGSRYYLALLGSAFSSTNPDLPNYQSGQDWLSDSVRQVLIDAVNGGKTRDEINAAINVSDLLGTVNPVLYQALEGALGRGELEPCVTSAILGESDLICQALREQDMAHILETTVNFPVTICHSVDDALVSPENRPNISLNSEYLSETEITGGVSHASAAGTCILNTILWYLTPRNVLEYPVVPKHLATCPSPTSAIPTSSPSVSMINAPTAITSSSSTGSSITASTVIPTSSPPSSSINATASPPGPSVANASTTVPRASPSGLSINATSSAVQTAEASTSGSLYHDYHVVATLILVVCTMVFVSV